MPEDSREVTDLLKRAHEGDDVAKDQLLEVIYDDLHERAKRAMRHQPVDHTLQPTALVNEAYLRLVGRRDEPWANEQHFLSVAARAMRQILVDHARGKLRDKRTAAGDRVPLDDLATSFEERAGSLTALDHALGRLAEFDPDMARAVELRFFGGASVQAVADAIGVPKRTFERRWKATRAWLAAEVL